MPKEKIAVVPGSFDPITLGHRDVIERSAKIFDKVIVVIAVNPDKSYMFTSEQKKQIAQISLAHLENVEVVCYDGIVVEYAQSIGAKTLIKGIRDAKDLEYEANIAKVNKGIAPEIETLYLPADESIKNISSTAVRKLLSYGMPIDKYVGKEAAELIAKMSK